MSSFTKISQYVSIYYGIPVFAAGMLGGILNVVVFLSLQTFRQNSCAFYLTIMSIVNIGELFTGLLSRIMFSGYGIDWTNSSLFYCKFRPFVLQTCTLISLSCICFATIDQYLATSSSVRWRQWSSLKVAHRLTIAMCILWSLHGILYLVFFAHVYSPLTGTITCGTSDATFAMYHTYGYFLTLTGFLPIAVAIIFALLAFRNVRQLAHLAVPLVRRELEKQLTIMVLVQVALNSFPLLSIGIVGALQRNVALTSNVDIAAVLQFANALAYFLYYLNFAVSVKVFDHHIKYEMIYCDVFLGSILHLYVCI